MKPIPQEERTTWWYSALKGLALSQPTQLSRLLRNEEELIAYLDRKQRLVEAAGRDARARGADEMEVDEIKMAVLSPPDEEPEEAELSPEDWKLLEKFKAVN